MPFEFATAGRIVFGAGTVREAVAAASRFGRRLLLVTGRSAERHAPIRAALEAAGLEIVPCSITGEPDVAGIAESARLAREARVEVVLGIGGGSVLDAAKAIGALQHNRGDLFDYLEVIGRGQPLTEPSLPVIAVPTTAGTGSEVARNAVLASPEHRVKVSLRSPSMLPALAVVDPELTRSMPPAVTASTGLDALTQLIEPYVSHRANPMTDGLCLEGIRRVARSLVRAFEDGRDVQAREDMALASLFGGLALANAGLGAVHGFAGPIGGMFDAPHGAVCAALLPHGIATNVAALRARDPASEALARYGEVARLLTGNTGARPEDGVAWVEGLCSRLGIPPLSAYGLGAADVPSVVQKAKQASSMRGNPVTLTESELTSMLEAAL